MHPFGHSPLGELQDGAHVTGKTIAELGYGNTPIDVIQFTEQLADGSERNMVMITHTDYSAQVVSVDEIMAQNSLEGLTEVVALGTMAGVEPLITPMGGILQVSDLDTQHLLTLRTNLSSNNLDLVTVVKGDYFRANDLVSDASLSGS